MTAGIDPKPFLWTTDLYYRLCEEGWFGDRRVELIGGEIVEMAAQHNFHIASITKTLDALRLAFGAGYWVRAQGTLDLSPLSAPDPDLAVVVGSHLNPAPTNPTTALLVVEVSDSTLHHDRNHKASLYAAAGIADYWIVNLVNRQVEVYRDPVPDPARPFGWRYSTDIDLQPGQTIAPLARPTSQVAVDDMLP